ncbi:TPA: DUF551 domain-containing protein [Escherichia albertii]|uniref:DUF551 domain-containing protein n=4 Tax=Escherichia TaxID=561 RepID=A0A765X614_ECOLX|nr:DUF551 domain-containing protein [Escherichia coli]EGM7736894.1 DUF551 domain-containing protein [Escherichia albertii]EGQ0035220.1 DUF551 domain-containing protein [Escherichia albertii]EHW5678029.1 DUF551 domain-containing protein [Escherichia albertii]EJZ0950392.1 DUF551 domain-containing protein [Escherichia albertii]
MINRTKLEHILEYAWQQRHLGQHCKIPPGDMVEIVEIAMRKTGNSPVTSGGWISCSERMPGDGQHVIILCDGAFVLHAQYRDGEFFDIVRNGNEFFETQSRNVTDWMPLPEPRRR